MPIRIEILTEIVVWLILGVFFVTAVFILATIQRRVNRKRYFEELDLARQRAQEVVNSFFKNKTEMAKALVAFAAFRSKAERQAMEDALIRHTRAPEELATVREILRKLGWIDEWVRVVRCKAEAPTGQAARVLAEFGDSYKPWTGTQQMQLRLRSGFLTRSMAANRLARVPTPEAICAFVAGISDPHPDVQEICVRHLGNSADTVVLPVLLEELVKVLEGRSRVSVRSIKTALVQFHLEAADGFIPVLEGANRRARFFAVDVLRESADRRQAAQGLLNKNDFSPALYRLFTEVLWKDEWGDVRARSASIIGHFHDPTSYKILEKLSEDKEWFVRLHTCRAVAGKFFLPVAPVLAKRLTDSHWLVREAAVRALMEMGDVGSAEIIHSFLTSEDRFATEQISEELQRSGLLITLLDTISEPGRGDEVILMVRKMIYLGKFAMILAYLVSPVPADRKLRLIPELTDCRTAECQQALQVCAKSDESPKVRAAALNVLQAQMAQPQQAPAMRGV